MRFNDAKEEIFFISDIKKFNHHQLFLSNDLRILAQYLSHNFSREDGSIFREKIVLTSTAAIQFWLQRELASSYLFHTKIFSFSRGIMELLTRMFSQHEKRLPNRLETLILIEENLFANREFANSDIPTIAFTFAQLFEKYSLYEDKLPFLQSSSDFQSELYRKVYNQSPFVSLSQWIKEKRKSTNMEIHLFALPYIPSLLFTFFLELGANIPVFFYQQNVCKEFWSDLLSAQELFAIEQKWHKEGASEEIIQALYDFSLAPFALANYGKLMREGLKILEENFIDDTSHYILRKKKTQLALYQNSLCSFEKVLAKKDDSIQFHVASAAIREVEITKSLLYHLIENEKIKPHEIKILAVDFAAYSAILKSELASFPMTILHEQNLSPGSALEGLLLFLKLEENRFTKEALLELFSFPSFAKKHAISKDEFKQIEEWIEQLHIRWGYNREQKMRILKIEDHPQIDASNTFEFGIKWLIRSIAQEDLVTLANIDLAAKFHDLIQSIYENIALFFESNVLEVGKLIEQCKKILELFFEKEEECNFDEIVHTFLPNFKEKKISFALFSHYLEERIRKRAIFENQRSMDTIFCTSLHLGSQLPCKIAIVLGMHLDAFPTKEISIAYDLLEKEEGFLPNNLDFEKNCFLELLNSCSEKLLFTYIKSPSLLLQELQDDLGDVTTYVHPPFCTDSSYFVSEDPYYSSCIKRVMPKVATAVVRKEEKKKEIALEKLIRFFKAPLFPFFLQQGLYFKNEEDEEFSLSALSKAKIVRKKEVACLIKGLKQKGAFPFYGFGEIAEHSLLQGRKELEEIFLFHKIEDCNLSTLYLTDQQIAACEKCYYHPPLIIKDRVIKGQLPGISKQGIFLFERANFEGIVRALPTLAIVAVTKSVDSMLLFGKEPKVRSINIPNPTKFLEDVIALYEEAHVSPLFIYPEFILPILGRDIKKLKNKIEELTWQDYDPYLSFMFRTQQLPIAEELIERLYEKIKHCFQEIIDANF